MLSFLMMRCTYKFGSEVLLSIFCIMWTICGIYCFVHSILGFWLLCLSFFLRLVTYRFGTVLCSNCTDTIYDLFVLLRACFFKLLPDLHS